MFGKSTKTKPAASGQVPQAAAPQGQKARSATVNTQIGKGTTIEGDLQFTGGLLIEGVVKGNLTAENEQATLILSEQGSIQGEVRVPNMVLNGSIDGDVFATDKVELFEKAQICGDVYYNLLEMAVGAEVNGKLVRQKPAEPSRSVSPVLPGSVAGSSS